MSCLPPETPTDLRQQEGRKQTCLDLPGCVTVPNQSHLGPSAEAGSRATTQQLQLSGVSRISPNSSWPNLAKGPEESMPLPRTRDDNWSKTAVTMSTVTIRWGEKKENGENATGAVMWFSSFGWDKSLRLAGLAPPPPPPPRDWAAQPRGSSADAIRSSSSRRTHQQALPHRPSFCCKGPSHRLHRPTRTQSLSLVGRNGRQPLADRHISHYLSGVLPRNRIETHRAQSNPALVNGELFRWGKKSSLFPNASANSLKHQQLLAVSVSGSRPAKQSTALNQPCVAAAEHRCANTISWGTFGACRKSAVLKSAFLQELGNPPLLRGSPKRHL